MKDNAKQIRIEALEQEVAALRTRCETTERALEAERTARQAFVSLVTHELRTPLTSIKGYTDLLLKGIMGPVNDAQENFLQTIRSNAGRMSRMLSDLSDINKIEGERLALNIEPVAVTPAVEKALAGFQDQIEQKSQTLNVTLPADLPPVRCDRERLIQILGNLLRNAVTYTPEGGSIDVSAEVKTDKGRLKVTVADDGIGIPADEQDRIFKPFFRASDEKTRQSPGNGLALHLTKQLLALQDGAIDFESERGVGTTFWLTLPLAQE
jgi:signal transduction histidine kinase